MREHPVHLERGEPAALRHDPLDAAFARLRRLDPATARNREARNAAREAVFCGFAALIARRIAGSADLPADPVVAVSGAGRGGDEGAARRGRRTVR